MSKKHFDRMLLLAAGAMVLSGADAFAGEAGQSFYLLGSKGSMAGFTPPPGTYVADLNYYYSGSASANAALGVALQRTGARDAANASLTVDANLKVKGEAYYNVPTAMWVAPGNVLGGNFGMSIATPMGWKSVDARLDALTTFNIPALNQTLTAGRSLTLEDQRKGFGEPILGAFIGWHSGNLHWNVGTMINVPVGVWNTGRLANIGFNHWAFDFTGAVTWLDAQTGVELSAAAGFTFNTENPDSKYKSGTDFHLELAAMQHFSKQLAIGVGGYHYEQVTGDSGTGAKLGDFKGRVSAVGPQLNYNFVVANVPFSSSVKWMHEFNAENRLKGDVGFVTVSVPLGGPPPPK